MSEPSKSEQTDYRKAIKDDESLALFLQGMAEFDREFCNKLAGAGEFTLRLEVHGQNGDILHVRVYTDNIRRPKGGRKGPKKDPL